MNPTQIKMFFILAKVLISIITERIRTIQKHIEHIDSLITKIQQYIETMVSMYDDYIQLICTIFNIDKNLTLSFLNLISLCHDNQVLANLLHKLVGK